MDQSPLDRLFARHFPNGPGALDRFRRQLAAANLDFPVEESIIIAEPADIPELGIKLPAAVHYFIPGAGFGSIKTSAESSTPARQLFTSDGMGLNAGCPVRLARALEMLSSLAPEERLEPLANLRASKTHLATVEEILWLTVWKEQREIRRGGELLHSMGQKARDIDWFFWSRQIPIYLEAKYRPTDWMRLADRGATRVRDSLFSDIGSKFPREKPALQMHIGAITGFAEPDASFFGNCERKLLSTPGLNAFLYRSLLGSIYVCSLSERTTLLLAECVQFPPAGEYPLSYGVQFDRRLQAQRLAKEGSSEARPTDRLKIAALPFVSKSVRLKYPPRFKLMGWHANGLPKFANVPAFLANTPPEEK